MIKRTRKRLTISFEKWDRKVEFNSDIKGDRVYERIEILGFWTPFVFVWDEWNDI